jgi:hypothetical protein
MLRTPAAPAPSSSLCVARITGLFALVLAIACGGEGATIAPIPPQTVAVRESLRIALVVDNPAGVLTFKYEAPEGLTNVDRSASISGTTAGGEFRWEPQVSHVGTHEFAFLLIDAADNEVHRRTALITVGPAADAAPVFLRPGAGGTYDLERDPCVQFDIEVRDDDSTAVEIGPRGALPEGASIEPIDDKRAAFEWCPADDQINTSERWTVPIQADDGDHPPTELNYVVVLRAPAKEGCDGAPPTVTITSPSMGRSVTGSPGFEVTITADDDNGLRAAPILYYSTRPPDDPDKPDVTMFDAPLFFDRNGATEWRVDIPPLNLDVGMEQTVYLVASATDNDDAMGTLCDHRTDTPLLSFTAVGGTGTVPTCGTCTQSSHCGPDAICAAAAGGNRCLPTCTASCAEGICGEETSVSGTRVSACGPVADVCGLPGGSCTDDSFEENDTYRTAATATDDFMAQLCGGDDDFFRIPASSGTEVTITLDGFDAEAADLDLALVDGAGAVRALSEDIIDVEEVSYCVTGGETLYAQVFSYNDGSSPYRLRTTRTSGGCCTPDAFEEDDTRATARAIVGGEFEGSICPLDPDYLRFTVSEPSHVRVTLLLDNSVGDLDLAVYGPSGTTVGTSSTVEDIEEVAVDVTATGTYVVHVYGYLDAVGSYFGELEITSSTGTCATTSECAVGSVCDAGTCRTATCTASSMCPSGHACPSNGPSGGTRTCAMACATNRDCRSSEACKWLPEGRYCGARAVAQNGDPCGTFADCGGQRACLSYPGGYCARVGCSSHSDCESDTLCVDIGGQYVCARDCWDLDVTCRTGYSCTLSFDHDDDYQFVCAP